MLLYCFSPRLGAGDNPVLFFVKYSSPTLAARVSINY